MPTDDDKDARGQDAPAGLDLGRLLRSDDSRTSGRLDADAVIRRSRRRRGTKLAGLTTAWVLAGTLVIGGGVVGLRQLAAGSGSSGSASSAASGSSGDKAQGTGGTEPTAAPPAEDAANPRCGSPAPVVTTTADGLAVTLTLRDTTEAAGSTASATVTLTNTGSETITGAVEQPRAGLVRGGVVTWHSPVVPTLSPRNIHLAAGDSTTFTVEIVADRCAAGQDDFARLPAARPGSYLAFTSIVVHVAAGDEVVVSEGAQLRIR
ncbi:MAG TPA: hypothetical protein VGM94_01955 [Galbitalea sp.]